MAFASVNTIALILALLVPAQARAQPRPPTPQTLAGLPLAETAGYGAKVPFVEYEAENAVTTGTLIGPDRRFTTLAAEASGRRAVRLAPGQHVEFVLARPANALTVRYAIPDGAEGRGRDASLAIRANGRPVGSLATTSRYGWFYGAYPFTNRPADGLAHHFYDEARLLLGRTLRAGKPRALRAVGFAAPGAQFRKNAGRDGSYGQAMRCA